MATIAIYIMIAISIFYIGWTTFTHVVDSIIEFLDSEGFID